MSRFRHALAERDAHILTLKSVIILLCFCLAGTGYGWYAAPRNLTLWFPPDLRTGSTRPWWEVPPASVYAFTFYIFQQLNRWPDNGEEDYARNLRALRAYLTPACQSWLEHDFQLRRDGGELRSRTRGIYELPGHGYSNRVVGDDKRQRPRVEVLGRDTWQVTLDVAVEEYYQNEPVKKALVRYPLQVMRYAIDAEKNPWGLAIDCTDSTPQRLVAGALP
ncbi:TIGR03746 family integrating conjugative element protein [Citrobacter freundii]|nr:TIGR03746 family integrating conjugative element protein [Citrobacter freundii]